MEDVIEVKTIDELINLIENMPDGVMVEVDLGEEEVDGRREGIQT